MSGLSFVNWEGRPAVISGGRAWAVLRDASFEPEGSWTEVNAAEVADSGSLVSASMFGSMFGPALVASGGLPAVRSLIDGSASAKAAG